jgi:hypothetical protein
MGSQGLRSAADHRKQDQHCNNGDYDHRPSRPLGRVDSRPSGLITLVDAVRQSRSREPDRRPLASPPICHMSTTCPDRDGSASLADVERDSWDNAKLSLKTEAHRSLTEFRACHERVLGRPPVSARPHNGYPCRGWCSLPPGGSRCVRERPHQQPTSQVRRSLRQEPRRNEPCSCRLSSICLAYRH